MVIQAVVDIDVDVDFGLAKAIKICSECGLKKVVSDSVKRMIHIVLIDDVEEKIRCLSSIKGFFTIDLRLFLRLCIYDNNVLKKLGIVPIPKVLSERSKIVGYAYVDDKICLLRKTSKQAVVMIQVLKTKSIPTFIEPSQYLIQTSNTYIYEKTLEILKVLRSFESKLAPIISNMCSEGNYSL